MLIPLFWEYEIIEVKNEEEISLDCEFPLDVFNGIIPRSREFTDLPQRNDTVQVSLGVGSDGYVGHGGWKWGDRLMTNRKR